jgi:hypothetical protein
MAIITLITQFYLYYTYFIILRLFYYITHYYYIIITVLSLLYYYFISFFTILHIINSFIAQGMNNQKPKWLSEVQNMLAILFISIESIN